MHNWKMFYWLKTAKICLLFFLCDSSNAQSFTLNGKITGKDSGYVILRYRDVNNHRRSDITSINRGNFQFKGFINGVDEAILDTDTNYVYDIHNNIDYSRQLFIQPGTINITFRNGDMPNAYITGSKVQTEYAALKQNQDKDKKELKRLSAANDSIRFLLKSGIINPQTAEEKQKEINKIYKPVAQSIRNSELSYIKKYSSSYLSLWLLKYLIGYISNDSIDSMYSSLSDKVKGSSLDYGFLEYYSKYRKAIAKEYPFDKIKVNERAPYFTVYKTLADSITLENFSGKVLLFEFWELSCLPCLKSNPLLENIRRQYGKNELKIIAINNTGTRQMPDLISYITKNNLFEWIHVNTNAEVNQLKNFVFKGDVINYSGLGVPRTVLIDKSGRVVYKNFGYSAESMQNLKLLIDKAVNENSKQSF